MISWKWIDINLRLLGFVLVVSLDLGLESGQLICVVRLDALLDPGSL